MNNKEIIESIKSKLTSDKDTDVAYLQTEMAIYRNMQNDEVTYAIANMLFQYLDPKVREKLDLKTHAILDERREKYEQVLSKIDQQDYKTAENILLELIAPFEKATFIREQNYYDFDQMIEYFIFCENVSIARKLHIKRFPEPITYYMYQLATIYQKTNNLDKALKALEKALIYNPRCQYVIQEKARLLWQMDKADDAFITIKESLKYAYTKEQLAFAYKLIGDYYTKKECTDIAFVAYLVSDNYANNTNNKELALKLPKLNIKDTNDILKIFTKYNIQYGISEIVIKAIESFLSYSKKIADDETTLYILNIAYELTDDEGYKQELQKLYEEKENVKKRKSFKNY